MTLVEIRFVVRSIVIMALINVLGSAQAQNFETLLKTIDTSKDSAKVLALNEVSLAVRDTNENLAFQFAEKAKALAYKLQYKKGIGAVLANLGWIYFRRGDYLKAYEVSSEGMAINQQLGNKREMANCIFNLGLIDSRLRKYDSALISYKTAYLLSKEVDDKVGMSKSLNGSAFCLVKLKRMDSAKTNSMLVLSIAASDTLRLATAKRNLGDIYFQEGKYSEALKSLKESIALADAVNNNFLMMSSRYRIGKTYIRLNDPDRALVYLKQNVAIAARKNLSNRLKSTYQFTSEAYARKKDFTMAYKYLVLANQQKDSLNEQLSEQQFALAQAKHESNLKNARISLLTKDSLLKENEINSQKRFIYLGSATLIVLVALVVTILRGYKRSRAVNKLLINRNEMIRQQAEELKNLNATKDKIFSIIGHDMRSPLMGLHGLLSLISRNAITQKEFLEFSADLRQNLEYVRNDLDNLLNWANAQLKGAKPIFKNVPVYQVVNEKINLLVELAKAKNISFQNDVASNVYIFTDSNHLGLIVRNLLANAVKFSHAGGTITVSASVLNDVVQLTVADTGVGMSDEDVNKLFKLDSHFTKKGTQNEKGMGLGLLLVKEFIQINNGSISVTSKIGQGSSFTVSMKGKYVSDMNALSA